MSHVRPIVTPLEPSGQYKSRQFDLHNKANRYWDIGRSLRILLNQNMLEPNIWKMEDEDIYEFMSEYSLTFWWDCTYGP
jgi:hypothetical protein